MRMVAVCGWSVCTVAWLSSPCSGQVTPAGLLDAPVPRVAANDPAPAAIAPLTIGGRASYALRRSFGPESVGFAILAASIQTGRGRPDGWGSDWDGFAQRFGMKMSRSMVSNGIDFGAGAALGTDPRYRRLGQGGFGTRLKYALGASFYHYDSQGRRVPALSRFAGIAGSNLIVNHWMPPGDNERSDIAWRCSHQLAWHIGWTVLREFGPDLKRKLRK